MINPYYSLDENLKTCFKINLKSHNVNHSIFILTITPIYPNFGFETRYNNKIPKKMATIYARLLNQYKYKNHILFSASFYMIIEEDQRSDELNILSI